MAGKAGGGKRLKVITSWSFTRYQDYVLCPFKAKLKHVDKLKEPGSQAMDRGADLHEKAEHYIKGLLKTLPPELVKHFKKELNDFRKMFKEAPETMSVEDTWAFRKDWSETKWDDWEGCWLRIKVDLAHHEDEITLVVTDWKTGKFRQEEADSGAYAEQLELYALGGLLLYPHIELVKPRLVYLDQGLVYPPDGQQEFTRADVDRLKKKWEKATKAMLTDTLFPPRPNSKCKWCHFRKENGGPCKF